MILKVKILRIVKLQFQKLIEAAILNNSIQIIAKSEKSIYFFVINDNIMKNNQFRTMQVHYDTVHQISIFIRENSQLHILESEKYYGKKMFLTLEKGISFSSTTVAIL